MSVEIEVDLHTEEFSAVTAIVDTGANPARMPECQCTLEGFIAWSYDLLTPRASSPWRILRPPSRDP